jgi:hypothetical protein
MLQHSMVDAGFLVARPSCSGWPTFGSIVSTTATLPRSFAAKPLSGIRQRFSSWPRCLV